MGWVAPVLAGVGALGGLFGNRPQTFHTTNNTQGGSTTSANVTGTQGQSTQQHVALDPRANAGYDALTQQYMNLIGQDPNLSGYQATQSNQINNLARIQQQNSAENLAARGVTGPAAATAANNVEAQRVGQQVNLSNSIPLLARQLQESTLGQAGGFFNTLPRDIYNTGIAQNAQVTNQSNNNWQSNQGTSQSPGNQLGGLFGGLGNILGLLYGMNGGQNGGSRNNFGGTFDTSTGIFS